MPYLEASEVLKRILEGSVIASEGLVSLVDRNTGAFALPEGLHLDFKTQIDHSSLSAIGECSRDILGFSNAEGGALVIGFDDSGRFRWPANLDIHRLHDQLGPFIGTRVTYEMGGLELHIAGRQVSAGYILVPRNEASYPHLLRKDIIQDSGFSRKTKYVRGSLFYRVNASVLTESPYGDIDGVARELRFTGVGPRTTTSFQIVEDRPLLRMYSPINNRFFGRDREVNTMIGEFDNVRGRGISIGGFGGMGKTELAIHIVSRLHQQGRFKAIYSGSAKQTLLGSTGPQQADPVFIDLRSFLIDLAGWLGLNTSPNSDIESLKVSCISGLKNHGGKKILIFVDNLETVQDRELFEFLDNSLPDNCWLLATARVHKLRRYLAPFELLPMIEGDDAARLLRHELKRQGLNELAGSDIKLLKEKAANLAHHPLAIRWFAWSCKKDRALWDKKIELVDLKQIEDFCVSSTLFSLGVEAQKVLGAILAIDSPSEATADCIAHTAEIVDEEIDPILWDLECSGLLNVVTDENGITTYSVAPMAQRLSKEAARMKNWETGYVTALRRYNSKRRPAVTTSPLIRDLLGIRPTEIRHLSKQEKEEVIRRVDRALPSAPPADRARLLWRKAECARHLSQAVTADEVYMQAAEEALRLEPPLSTEEMWHLLLEAATVAKARSTGISYTERAVRYLRHVLKFDAENTRVVGMLAELYGILGNEEEYLKFDNAGRRLLEVEDPDGIYAGNLRFALDRARENYVWSARNRKN